jgi:hypothetical protein
MGALCTFQQSGTDVLQVRPEAAHSDAGFKVGVGILKLLELLLRFFWTEH